MKKVLVGLIALAAAVGISMSANVIVSYTGPSDQGDIVYKSPATAVTNFAMGTGGLYHVKMDPRYSLSLGAMSGSSIETTGNAVIGGATTSATLKVTGSAIIGDGLTVNTNASVGGTLGVTGVATLTATPVCKNGLTVGTNISAGGNIVATGSITGANVTATSGVSFPDGAVAAADLSVAAAKLIVGNASGYGAAQTLSGDATIDTNGALTIASRAVEGTMLPQATDGQLFVGMSVGGSNVIARTVTGNVTIDSNGVTTVGSGQITNSMLCDGIALSRLEYGTAAYVPIVGNDGYPVYKAISGSVTITTNGVVTIGANAVTNSMLTAGIGAGKLAADATVVALYSGSRQFASTVSTTRFDILNGLITNTFYEGP